MALSPQEELELLELEEQDHQETAKASPSAGSGLTNAKYKSPGEAEGGGSINNFLARIKDPERYKAVLGMNSPAANPDVVAGSVPMAMPAASAPTALAKLAQFLNASAPKRIALGAAQGVISDPQNPGMGALKGAGTAALGEGVGKLLTGAGDVGMQMAVGRKKFTQGVGTQLADEGLLGTRGMLAKQTNSKLAERGAEISDLAKQVPNGAIDSTRIAQEIAGEAASPMLVQGAKPSTADMTKLGSIRDFAEDVASRGAESGPQALSRRIAAGQRSYRGKEDPLQSLLGSLSKKEQMKYSSALKDAHKSATGTTALADADKSYGALKRAQASLEEDIKLPRSVFGALSTGASHVPLGSAGLSAIGQAATKTGQGATNPILRQMILEATKKDER